MVLLDGRPSLLMTGADAKINKTTPALERSHKGTNNATENEKGKNHNEGLEEIFLGEERSPRETHEWEKKSKTSGGLCVFSCLPILLLKNVGVLFCFEIKKWFSNFFGP